MTTPTPHSMSAFRDVSRGEPEILRFTATSILVRNITDSRANHAAEQLHAEYPETEIQYGIKSVLVTHPNLPHISAAVTKKLDAVLRGTDNAPKSHESDSASHHVIPVNYNGEDLQHAADAVTITVAELVRIHTHTAWRVEVIGFAPGFAYLTPEGADGELWHRLPRHSTPRQQVPAGSVAVAAGRSAIYPTAMPGGWNILGTTDATLFDPHNIPPTRFTRNDTVTFTALGAQ